MNVDKTLHARMRAKAMHEQIRRSIAMHMLNGMLASAPMVDRTKIKPKPWVKKAYEFADELIKQGDKR